MTLPQKTNPEIQDTCNHYRPEAEKGAIQQNHVLTRGLERKMKIC
jgi:hypothetical protein